MWARPLCHCTLWAGMVVRMAFFPSFCFLVATKGMQVRVSAAPGMAVVVAIEKGVAAMEEEAVMAA